MKKATAFIQAYMSPDVKAKFQDICNDKGTTASNFLRELVIKYIKDNERNLESN